MSQPTQPTQPTQTAAINIIFDAPPGPQMGRFVEVETDDGRSVSCGEWIERPDGFWALRITHLPPMPNTKRSDGEPKTYEHH